MLHTYLRIFRHYNTLPGSIISKLLDSISSGLQALVDTVVKDLEVGDRGQDVTYRAPLEIYAFLLQWFCAVAEQHTSKGGTETAMAAPTKTKVRYAARASYVGFL
jgi:condensin complex subunit 1